ncbi:MAG: NUDIX domain-containing protein [Oscillospiraceae bacterium]|nr:NUDIX domain-containing protein [Oscillospiraceae bacterium]
MQEHWDLYDENRNKIGKTHLRGEPLEKGEFHIVVNVWIINSKNEVLLAQRHPDKWLGGMWECSASGGVLAGEDSLQGALRETKEEIGVTLPPSDAILIQSIVRKDRDDIRDTFLFKMDVCIDDLILHPYEVVSAKWVTEKEYNHMCNEGIVTPPTTDFWELYTHR